MDHTISKSVRRTTSLTYQFQASEVQEMMRKQALAHATEQLTPHQLSLAQVDVDMQYADYYWSATVRITIEEVEN